MERGRQTGKALIGSINVYNASTATNYSDLNSVPCNRVILFTNRNTYNLANAPTTNDGLFYSVTVNSNTSDKQTSAIQYYITNVSNEPNTGEPVITQALLTVAQMPLFVGVGGGTTTGPRVTELAMVAEMQGAAGVVINAPAPAETIETTMSMVDIPVIATVTEDDEITECKILAGAAIINVAAGARTAQVVASIRAHHPEIPILASGGGSEDRILATIEAGADAITWTPPSAQQLQSQMMAKYRGEA